MNEPNDSHNDTDNHNSPSSAEVSAQFGGNLTPSSRTQLPLKVLNSHRLGLQKMKSSEPQFYLQNHHMSSSQLTGNPSPRAENHSSIANNVQGMDLATREKLRSDKSYSDLHKSLYNLNRVTESSSSVDEMFRGKSRTKPSIERLGPRLSDFRLQAHSTSLSQQKPPLSENRDRNRASKMPGMRRNDDSNPFAVKFSESDRNRESNLPPRSNRVYMKSGDNSRFQPQKIPEVSIEYRQKSSTRAINQRPLLTEGDSPVGREDFLSNRFAELSQIEERNRWERQRDDSNRMRMKKSNGATSKDHHKNPEQLSTKLKFEKQNIMYKDTFSGLASASKAQNRSNIIAVTRSNYTVQTEMNVNENYETHEILNFNNISDGVQYGFGGVGYSATGRKERKMEGGSRDKSNSLEKRERNEMNKTGQSTGRGSRVITVSKDAMDTWKKELLDIKRDIQKRKKSHERVNKFLKMCDPDKDLLLKPESISSNNISPSHTPNSRQSYQVLHTMPAFQERSTSPIFSPLERHPDFYPRAINSTLNLSNMERSTHDKQRKKEDRDIRFFTEIRTTDDGEEPRFGREDQTTTQDYHSRIKTIPSRYELPSQPCELSAGSFVNSVPGGKCYKSPCCGTNPGCQMF